MDAKEDTKPAITPKQARRVQAIITIRKILDEWEPHERLSIALMTSTKLVEELIILNPGARRGKVIKAAQADFQTMLHRFVAMSPVGSGPSEPIPEDHPVNQQETEPDPGKAE